MKRMIFLFILATATLLGGQQWSAYNVSSTAMPVAPITGTTNSLGGGALIAGQAATATATVTGANTVGKPCIASPSDGTSLAGLGVGVSVGCSITATGVATVVVTASIAGTPTAKTYTVVAYP